MKCGHWNGKRAACGFNPIIIMNIEFSRILKLIVQFMKALDYATGE